ncbi:MAG TPA: phosphatidate cytidylyltransferase [Candidatus Binatia bacterium]|jgi:phosphatidate cytidylyltransferase|nr:phosphatidate cytidylyltransferase [Candidatus Binatia bacterium]
MLRTRLATAAIALPTLWLLIQYLWPPLFTAFIVTVVAIGLFEYGSMAFPDDRPAIVATVVFGLLVAAGVITGQLAWAGAGLFVAILGGMCFPLARHGDLTLAVNRLGLLVLGVLYVGFLMPHVILLRHQEPEGWRWVLFTVFVAMGSDSGGYFAGRFLGKHKLAPAISPSKTIEGAVGAVAGAMLIAWLASLWFFDRRPAGEALVLAVAISVLAQFGDLCESALKRAFGAKDSGWIIPGHGGILDRLDSLLFPFVFAYYYAVFPRV